jgi:hypothetical protein
MDKNLQPIDDRHVMHRSKKTCPGYTGIIKHRISSELAAHFTATFYMPRNIDFRYDLDRAIEEGRKKGEGQRSGRGQNSEDLWEKHVGHHAESCR